MIRERTCKRRHEMMTWRDFVATLAVLTAGALFTYTNAYAEDQTVTVLAHASSGPLQCEIRKTDAGDSVELIGTITSSVAVSGNFRFLVTKFGPSGSSNINQGNKFDLAAGSQTHVGRVTINLEPDAHVVVELLATSNDGIECRAKAPLER
jgi:hypothetical protein